MSTPADSVCTVCGGVAGKIQIFPAGCSSDTLSDVPISLTACETKVIKGAYEWGPDAETTWYSPLKRILRVSCSHCSHHWYMDPLSNLK